MPRISAATLADHRALVWKSLFVAFDDLLMGQAYESITLADVATKAGMSRSSVYNYIPDTETLLAAALADASSRMVEDIRAIASDHSLCAADRFAAIIDYLLHEFPRGGRRLFVLYARLGSMARLQQDSAQKIVDGVMSTIGAVLSEGIAAGEFRSTDEPDLDLRLLSALMEQAMRQSAESPDQADAIRQRAKALVLGAIAQDCSAGPQASGESSS